MVASEFDIRNYLDDLEPAKEKGKYHCPACEGHNLSIDQKTGKFQCWTCGDTKMITRMLTAKEREHRDYLNSYSYRPSSSRPSSQQKPLPTIELARLPEQPKTPQSVTKGNQVITVYPYASGQEVRRIEQFEGSQRLGKKVLPYHQQDTRMVAGKGDLPWNAYRINEAIRHGKGKWVLGVEGEKCVEVARQNQIPAITWQGGSGRLDDILAALLTLKRSGVKGLIYSPDYDEPGTNKAEKVIKAAQQIDFPVAVVNPVELYPEMPEKGDIVDWVEQVELTPDERVKQLEQTARLITPQPQNQPLELPTNNVKGKDNKAIKIAMERNRARQVIGNQLRFNERTREIEIFCKETDSIGERFDLDFPDIQLVKHWGLGIELGARNTEGVIREIAKENSYEPVRDYLEECAENHRDTSILDNLAETLFGATEPIHQTIFRKTLISAVARVYEPGCKCESVTILLSPRQGINKSRTWQTLFGREYFCDNVGDISNKDEVAKLHRVWGCEWSEFESITSKKDVGKIKSFLSTSVDLIREPYGRKCEPIPRRAIIVGTTNRDDFLRDDTGNRRFNIIEVNKQEIDIDWLKEHRDQIWAAAVHLYKQGENWWLTASEQKQSNEINEDFRDELPLEQEIADLVAGKDKVTTRWIIGEIKSVETDRYADQDKVSRVISKVLTRQGTWKRNKFRDDAGNSVRGYVRVNQEQVELSVETVPQASGTNLETGTPMRNVSKSSLSSDSGNDVPHVPLKKQIPQENKKPDTQPQPEQLTIRIKADLINSLLSSKRVSQKEFFSRYPNHLEEVETVIQEAEKIPRIQRANGWIYSIPSRQLEVSDKVVILEGNYKGCIGEVEKYNSINSERIHTYIVTLNKGFKKEPLLCLENQLKRC
jgi:predicted P-loop ATPase/predicted RNA-binding Zn-ribbon protein involved in translation (DUF1610 family)